MHPTSPLPLAFLVLIACDRTDDTASAHLATCTFADAPSANFEVTSQDRHDGTWAYMSGRVMDGTEPSFHTLALESEQCRYYYYLPTSCDPACEGGALCVSGDCVDWPEGLSAGTLTIEGLGETLTVEPEPHVPGTYYTYLAIGDDTIAESGLIRLSLEGDDFPAVDLRALGVAAIETPAEDDGLLMQSGQAATLEWDEGDEPKACVEVWLYTSNTGHGQPIANVMHCVASDTGSLTIPEEMVDIWPPFETPGLCAGIDCPYSELVRYTRHVVNTDAGDAWLTVAMQASFPLATGD